MVKYREQQIAVFRLGSLKIPEEEKASLARRIHHMMEQLYDT